jgi:hypothetical protein
MIELNTDLVSDLTTKKIKLLQDIDENNTPE